MRGRRRTVGALLVAVLLVAVSPAIQAAAATGTRADSGKPFFGGARYITTPTSDGASIRGVKEVEQCSTGFAWKAGATTYLLTAGHCYRRGTQQPWAFTYRTSGGKPQAHNRIGRAMSTNVDSKGTFRFRGQYLGDLALIKAPSYPRVFHGSATDGRSIVVTGQWNAMPRKGDRFCTSGATTGAHCGWEVTRTGVTLKVSGGRTYRGLTEAKPDGKCIKSGDSGGAVYTVNPAGHAVAKGIISSVRTNLLGGACRMYFTPIQSAVTAFAGKALTYPSR